MAVSEATQGDIWAAYQLHGGRSLMWHNSGLSLQPNPCHYDSNNAPRSSPGTQKTTCCRLMMYWFLGYEVCPKGKCWSVGWETVSGCVAALSNTNQQVQLLLQPIFSSIILLSFRQASYLLELLTGEFCKRQHSVLLNELWTGSQKWGLAS